MARQASAATTARSIMAVNDRRSIREQKIIDRLEEFFGRRIRDLNAPLGDFYRGDANAVLALAPALNRYDGFHDDKLGLAPADFQGISTIGAIVTAIVIWYLRHGWNVIHR